MTSPYLRVVRASAWYDLVVTAGFATPWTYAMVHDVLSLPERDVMQTLLANLMGSVVVVWALLRIVRPQPEHGLFDGIARTLFSAWIAYALAHGGPHLLWGFLVVEVAFGVAQLAPLLLRSGADDPGRDDASGVVEDRPGMPGSAADARVCRRGDAAFRT
ncbi:hypothetical protein [Streptomyces sp. NPDC050738]|uniref:hypothetical protein n=1 Tax=Streptomyces sp. NPDC050738 TaxID=3154744 RepID=UPI00342BEB51